VEVLRYLVGGEVRVTWHAIEPEEEAGAVFPDHPSRFLRCGCVGRAAQVLPKPLAPEPALEPYPVSDNNVF